MNAPTIAQELAAAAQELARAGIDMPELDATLLLAHVLGVDRTWLIAHARQTLTPQQRQAWQTLLNRRQQRQPLAYITGQRWFYDLLLHVTPAVLIPRPETEELVQRALAWLQTHPHARVADIGTGSGAIALAVAKHAPAGVTVLGCDISARALDVARANARRLGLTRRLSFRQGDLLSPLPQAVDLLLANLPYVAERERAHLMPEVGIYEPPQALFGGVSGLDLLRRLLQQAPAHMQPGGRILLEMGYNQGSELSRIARRHFPAAAIRIHKDLAGHDRILEIDI